VVSRCAFRAESLRSSEPVSDDEAGCVGLNLSRQARSSVFSCYCSLFDRIRQEICRGSKSNLLGLPEQHQISQLPAVARMPVLGPLSGLIYKIHRRPCCLGLSQPMSHAVEDCVGEKGVDRLSADHVDVKLLSSVLS
jgi:hypothetical protein